jgi:hypothetical protein
MEKWLIGIEFLLRMLDVTRYEVAATTYRHMGLWCTGGIGPQNAQDRAVFEAQDGEVRTVWVPSGSGWLETAAMLQRMPVGNSSLIWLFPDVMHSYAPNADGWVERWAMFGVRRSRRLSSLAFFHPYIPCTLSAPSLPSMPCLRNCIAISPLGTSALCAWGCQYLPAHRCSPRACIDLTSQE